MTGHTVNPKTLINRKNVSILFILIYKNLALVDLKGFESKICSVFL